MPSESIRDHRTEITRYCESEEDIGAFFSSLLPLPSARMNDLCSTPAQTGRSNPAAAFCDRRLKARYAGRGPVSRARATPGLSLPWLINTRIRGQIIAPKPMFESRLAMGAKSSPPGATGFTRQPFRQSSISTCRQRSRFTSAPPHRRYRFRAARSAAAVMPFARTCRRPPTGFAAPGRCRSDQIQLRAASVASLARQRRPISIGLGKFRFRSRRACT